MSTTREILFSDVTQTRTAVWLVLHTFSGQARHAELTPDDLRRLHARLGQIIADQENASHDGQPPRSDAPSPCDAMRERVEAVLATWTPDANSGAAQIRAALADAR